MTVVWILLAPLILVVGVGALAASAVLVVALGAVFGGPFEVGAGKLRYLRRLWRERGELASGRWAVIEAAAARGLVARYREVVTLGPVRAQGKGRFWVATEGGAPVVLCHRGLRRVVDVGGRERDVRGWLRHLHEQLVARFVAPLLAHPVADMEALATVLAHTNKLLPTPVALDLTAESPREVLAAARGHTPYAVVPVPEKAVLRERFAAYCAFHGVKEALEDMEHLFPEASEADTWLAASRLAARDRDVDEEPLQLYLAGERYVHVRFSLSEPWVVGSYPHAAAYLFEVVVKPALDEFVRSSALAIDPFEAW